MASPTSMDRLAGTITGGLDRFNARHPWSHNDHFHRWILRQLPPEPRRVLDVGCGTGELIARLADRGESVVGIDADAAMAAVAAERFAGRTGIEVRYQRFEELPPSDDGTFDAVTMIASLHHLPLAASLRRAGGLLAPGGSLLVVGLAQVGSARDLALGAVSTALDPLVGLAKHPRPQRPAAGTTGTTRSDPAMPVRDPDETYGTVAATTAQILPGSRFRRRLFYRYTLEWTAP